MKNIKSEQYILYGTGAKGNLLWNFAKEIEKNILFWIDGNPQKWGLDFMGKKIYPVKEIEKYPEALICIAAVDEKNEMKQYLFESGVEEKRIIQYNELIMRIVEMSFEQSNDFVVYPNKKSAILVDCTKGLNLGGLEEWSKSLVLELFRRNYEAFLVGPYAQSTNIEMLDRRVISVELEQKLFFCKRNILKLIECMKQNMPCTVITGSINPFFIAACIIKRKYPDNIRIISVIHQGIESTYKEYMDMYAYIDNVVAVSEDIKSGMIRRGCPSESIFHITCPVQCENVLKRSYSDNEDYPIRLAYAGRIVVPQKRMDILLQLVTELEKRKINYRFEIAGEGDYTEEIELYIKRNNLQEKIILVGKLDRSNMPDFWKKQDICINVADHEGRSLSIMEAMANGAVPIVTVTSGVREDIQNEVNGYYVEIGDYESIALKIKFLSNNRKLLRILGEKAHEEILKKSDMSQHITFWENLLGNVN